VAGPNISRRAILDTALATAAAAAVGGCVSQQGAAVDVPRFEFEEMSIADLQSAMQSGQLTSKSLTNAYLDRIAALDRRGPRLNHVIETNPDAMEIAAALDAERKAKGPRGPLHGIPILVKDNIDTADRMHTSAGSLALAGSIVPRDAFLIANLRRAGAVILGKANMSEWANFRSAHSSSGWSGRGGQAKNPYALDRTPSGSSSGSAGAVAANMCAVAIGTETDGSIVSPSSCCSVVGIKPTLGLVSRAGIVPIAHSQDTAGPIARTVADAAALLSAIAGADPADAATQASRVEKDYTRFLDKAGLRGARIGIARSECFHFDPPVVPILSAAIAAMKEQGATVVDPIELPTADKFGDAEGDVLLYEFKADVNAYLSKLGGDVPARTLEQLIAFNRQHAKEEMPFFGQELFEKAQAKGGLETPAYVEALAKCRRLTREEGLDAAMQKDRLNAIVMITGGPPTLIDLVNGDYDSGGSSTLAAVAGYPSITVPAGYVFGLPVGLSFTGRAWSEGTLLRLAYAFEQATKIRRKPTFRPTAELRAY